MTKARLRWAWLGLGVAMVNLAAWLMFWAVPFMTADMNVGSQLTARHGLFAQERAVGERGHPA